LFVAAAAEVRRIVEAGINDQRTTAVIVAGCEAVALTLNRVPARNGHAVAIDLLIAHRSAVVNDSERRVDAEISIVTD
jgi:hypothetical protein